MEGSAINRTTTTRNYRVFIKSLDYIMYINTYYQLIWVQTCNDPSRSKDVLIVKEYCEWPFAKTTIKICFPSFLSFYGLIRYLFTSNQTWPGSHHSFDCNFTAEYPTLSRSLTVISELINENMTCHQARYPKTLHYNKNILPYIYFTSFFEIVIINQDSFCYYLRIWKFQGKYRNLNCMVCIESSV